jgi:serine/arginine repetitive matrix protein 2
MYNGIGLTSARGSGTNGYVQANKAFLRPKQSTSDFRRANAAAFSTDDSNNNGYLGGRKPNAELLLHEKKRQVEIACLELRDSLEEEGVEEEDIERRVDALREKLLRRIDSDGSSLSSKGGPVANSHQAAAVKMMENERAARAFGIKTEGRTEGEAFDKDLQV